MNPFQDRMLPEFVVRHRAWIAGLVNVGVIALAYALAFLLRFDLVLPSIVAPIFWKTLPIAIVVQYASFAFFKLSRGWWRYVGMADFLNAVKAAFVGSTVLSTLMLFLDRHHFPRSISIIFPILVIGLSMGVRLAVRLWRQIPAEAQGPRRRIAIVGAGDTGEALLREARQSGRLSYHVVAFFDDDVRKKDAYINGVPVVGQVKALVDHVERLKIDEIVVATPSASGDEMRGIIDVCRASGKPFKVMPATWEVLSGGAGFRALREVDINDLLRRPPIALDLAGIGAFLTGKRVLITGAAGSIGSELCRQILRFAPEQLLCLDHDENALFFLERDLRKQQPDAPLRAVLADITDTARIDDLFRSQRPNVVFHAAAHKHVPLIEGNPAEGMRNNVFGTECVATAAGRHGTEAFVMISTDKAVNPTSMMGASKRVAELVLQSLPFDTRYTAVRFGNVLGSQGSVVPLLKEQIAAGGPVTITHPDMRRYFMTIPEAVELVLQAGAMGKGDQILILDMGEPVKIVDLARDLITLSGLRPGVDVDIVFSGVRPGEKLFEELFLEGENADRTSHPKILTARHQIDGHERLVTLLDELRAAVARCDDAAVRRLVPRLVPEYQNGAFSGNVLPMASARPLLVAASEAAT